ncbi:MAG: hypothetical protein KDD25_00185 [Bdellovibrionales bacterium]|nr:hypothetical protein [Bdellovibrionales bacterium]
MSAEEIAIESGIDPSFLRRVLGALVFIGELTLEKSGRFLLSQKSESKTPEYRHEAIFWLAHQRFEALHRKVRLVRGESFSEVHFQNLIKWNILKPNGEVENAYQEQLDKRSPNFKIPSVLFFEQVLSRLYSFLVLERTITEGGNQWRSEYDLQSNDSFSAYGKRDDLLIDLVKGFHFANVDQNRAAIKKFKTHLDGARRALDVGGSLGAFARQLEIEIPSLEDLSILEKPEAKNTLDLIRRDLGIDYSFNYFWDDFLQFQDDNYFHGVGSEETFDIVSLGWILHDWSDETSLKILKRSAGQLNSGGHLIILERVLDSNLTGPVTLPDIDMMLMTEGKERTLSEFNNLAAAAGFEFVDWIDLTPGRSGILYQKK